MFPEAVVSLKGGDDDRQKVNFGGMLTYLASSTRATNKEVRGVYRWFASLRLADTAVQLPAAKACIEWTARLLGQNLTT